MKWYEIKAKGETAEVWLYDEIGKDWMGEGISAKEFLAELSAIKSPKIDMHINSPGGAVFEGAAIYNAIKRHPATVTTYIDGIAASIASVIALAGDRIVMAANALFMIHNPSGVCVGGSEDMRKTADILDKVCGTMVGTYMDRSGKTESEIKALLDAETWMDAEETKAIGFCDEISDEMDMAACAKFIPIMSKLGFKHVPRAITDSHGQPTVKELERALRNAGCSASMSKSILAGGYGDRQRDVDPPTEPPVTEPPRDVVPPEPAKKDRTADLLIRASRMTALAA